MQTDNDHKAYRLIERLPEVSKVGGSINGLTVYVKENANIITKLLDALRLEGIQIVSISLVKPTLDDVFIHYTGRGFGDVGQENNSSEHGH